MDFDDEEDEQRPRFAGLRRAGWILFGLALLLGMGVLVRQLLSGRTLPQRQVITTVMKVVLPPPPPPPPPPLTPPPPEPQKIIEQPKVQEPVKQAETPKPKAAPKPANPTPAPPGNPLTAEAGNGPSQYGLGVGNGGGDVIGGGGGGGGGDRFGFYAGLIQSQVQSALRQDEKTRSGRYRVMVRLWLSATGQITRAQVVGSSGDREIDTALPRVLSGVSIGQGPPADMPQPVNVRISAQG